MALTLRNNEINVQAIYIVTLGILLFCAFSAFCIGFAFSETQVDPIKPMTMVSLLLFAVVCCLSVADIRWYYSTLVFVLLAFPSPVNDIFPGVFLGSETERGASVFPLATHIDIFLVLGIFLNLYRNRFNIFPVSSALLFLVVPVLFVSLVVNAFFTPDIKGMLLLSAGTFQLRFLILSILLISTEDITKYKNEILLGVFISVPFLLVEALVNSRLKGFDRLSSGSLAVNTFGNIISSIFVFCFFIFKRHKRYMNQALFVMIICGAIILLTQNRMSFFAVPGVFIFYYFLKGGGFLHKIKVFGMAVLLILLIPVTIEFSEKILPERFSIKKIAASTSAGSLSEGSLINVEQSKETSTLFTRMLLFNTSIKMIAENPFFGIGAGRWNHLKRRYGFMEHALIDSHNGILAVLSQYGLFSFLFIYFIYIYPIYLFKRIQKISDHPLSYLAFVNLTMFVCDLSNAGIFKYQVYAFMVLNAIILIRLHQSLKNDARSMRSADLNV